MHGHVGGRRTVLWGSGSKAVAFLTTVGLNGEVASVVDINPFRHGRYLAGHGSRDHIPRRAVDDPAGSGGDHELRLSRRDPDDAAGAGMRARDPVPAAWRGRDLDRRRLDPRLRGVSEDDQPGRLARPRPELSRFHPEVARDRPEDRPCRFGLLDSAR